VTILVTGATGTVGGEVVRCLCERGGEQVRALVRSPERGDDLRGYDADTAVGTFEDEDSLARALHGVASALLVTPSGPDQVAWETAFVRAAARAMHPPHVVKVAARGFAADSPSRFGRAHAEVMAALADSGLGFTVLAPTSFQQNLLREAAQIGRDGVISTPAGDGAISHVDVRDVGEVAARVLTDPVPHAGAVYDLTGPEALTYAEVAAAVSESAGIPVRYEPADPVAWRARLIDAGVSPWYADGLLELNAAYAAGVAAAVTDDVQRLTGSPPRALRAFLADHPAAFRSV